MIVVEIVIVYFIDYSLYTYILSFESLQYRIARNIFCLGWHR